MAIKLSRPAAAAYPPPSFSAPLAVPVNSVQSKVLSFFLSFVCSFVRSFLFFFFSLNTVIFYCHSDSRRSPPPFSVRGSSPCKSFRRQINLGLDHRLGHGGAYSSTLAACFPHELSATALSGDYSPPPAPPRPTT